MAGTKWSLQMLKHLKDEEDILADGLAKIGEAQKYLRLSRASIYKLMDSGQLAYVKIGGARRIQRRALVDLVERSVVTGKE